MTVLHCFRLTSETEFEILVFGGVDMAGKIALGILAAFALVGFGYALHREQDRRNELPFKVKQIFTEHDTDAIAADGTEPPFTVLVHETQIIQRKLPGVVGKLGDVIWMEPPGDR
jgi:hypothetical protein